MNKYIRIASVAAAVAALACACSREIVPEAEPEFVDMPFVFSAEDAQGDLTRAAASLFPEVENWIFDIYYCQYAADGPSLMSGHIRKNVAVTDGTLTATEQITLRTASNSTVVFAANFVPMGANYGDNPNWGETTITFGGVNNLGDLKNVKFDMSKRLAKAQDGTLKHMPMTGYWVGDVTGAAGGTGSKPATVTMGRLISKICVNITNNTAAAITSVKINNAAKNAYLFPQAENNLLVAADYTTFTDNVNIAVGETGTLYFYTAPNYCQKNGNVTSFTFTNAAGKKATQIVGSDMEVGDFNLYMNTIYTFHFTLK